MSPILSESLTIGDPESGRPRGVTSTSMSKTFKRRASKACSFCQWRKIRCNVEDRHPCNNCVLEQIDCAITKTRKSKKSKLDHVASEPIRRPEHDTVAPTTTDEAVSIGNDNPLQNALSSHDTFAIVDSGELSADQTEEASLPVHQPDQLVQASSLSLTPSAPSVTSPQGPGDTLMKDRAGQMVALPDFIEPMSGHLPPEDIEYLHKKGCFDIPAPKFRDAILCRYAEFFHPVMPLLDLGRFLYSITTPSPSTNRVSLLLFQAVMFAGSAHVDIKPLRMLGFLTRKAARRALYMKTKALYDMEYERNRLCVIQALAIMSHWYETPDDQKNACHWLQTALCLSQRAGLHRNPANMDMTETERRIRRRIWWSCLNRASLCALGLKAPLCYYPQDHDVPEMTVDDYDLGDVPIGGFDKVGHRWPAGKRRLLCLASVWQRRLHKELDSILYKQYELGDYRSKSGKTDGISSKMVLLPLTTESAKSNIEQLKHGLDSWRSSLPSELQTTAVGSEISDSGFEPFVVFRTVLHMIYHTCLITLYRPWVRAINSVLPTHNHEAIAEDNSQMEIQAIVRSAANSITQLAVELYQIDLVRHLPQCGLSALVAAVVSHISDMLSPTESIQQSGVRGFEQCSHMLNELRENFFAADFSSDFVQLLAQARKLPHKSMTREGDLILRGDRLDDQISAQSWFAAVPVEAQEDRANSISGTKVTRPLPEALFPEGVDLSYHLTTNQESVGWELPVDFQNTLEDVPTTIPVHHADEWDYYRNFREETVRLLGDFYEDFQPTMLSHTAEAEALPAL